MSTLAAADPSSDDENDQDFRPAEPKSKARGAKKRRRSTSASGSSSSDSDDDQDVKVENEEAVALRMEQEAAEAEQRKRRAEAAFQAMKAGGSSSTSAATKAEVAMVTVQRARRFAGETLYETVQLPADDPEAIAYLKQGSSNLASNPAESLVESDVTPVEQPPEIIAEAGPSKPKIKAKPPPRRKPRQSLEAMSAALDKGKKMTTLEKLDWKKHTSGDQSINDELEANRKAGGYLQKKDFLERVGERRMDTFENRQSR